MALGRANNAVDGAWQSFYRNPTTINERHARRAETTVVRRRAMFCVANKVAIKNSHHAVSLASVRTHVNAYDIIKPGTNLSTITNDPQLVKVLSAIGPSEPSQDLTPTAVINDHQANAPPHTTREHHD
jgi:hypothetical protein